MEEKTDAVVIKSIDYKDNDKILTLFSAELGVITAGARGVRRNGAKLRFATEPFTFSEYVLASKGDRFTVTNAYLYDGFYNLRTDIERYYAACAVTEAVALLVPEGAADGDFFVSTVNALKGICYENTNEALAKFLYAALVFSGFRLDLGYCGECGEEIKGEKLFFDFSTGRFSCAVCHKGTAVSGCTYEFIKKISAAGYDEKLITPDASFRAVRLLRRYLAARTETDLNSLSYYINLPR